MFANAEVDATGVDFSDRIARKRKSYIVSTRRRRHAAATDAPSDDEGWEGEPETVTQRLARLRREVEELRVQISEKKGEVIGDADEVDQESGRGLDELAEALEALVPGEGGAQERLAKKLVRSLGAAVQVKREVPAVVVGGDEVGFLP